MDDGAVQVDLGKRQRTITLPFHNTRVAGVGRKETKCQTKRSTAQQPNSPLSSGKTNGGVAGEWCQQLAYVIGRLSDGESRVVSVVCPDLLSCLRRLVLTSSTLE